MHFKGSLPGIQIHTLLIDLDDTVYPSSCGVWDHIQKRMETYMHERLGIPSAEVPGLRREMYLRYGTTLRGLQMTRHIDERDFLAYVHNVPVEELIHPDPALRETLLRYAQRKYVFTNADQAHAHRVIRRLELEDVFDGIIDILAIAPFCKPMREAFEIALSIAGVRDPRQCAFIDDGINNLNGARAAGLCTIRVGADMALDGWDACISELKFLPSVLPPAKEDGQGEASL